MGVEVKPVNGIRGLKQFVSFPYSLYDGNAFWVPPLRFTELQTFRWDKNPAFEFCEVKYWLAFKNGKPVGRIAGILNNRYIETWGKKTLRFGYIEFIDDEEVSAALLKTVESWAKKKGMQSVHGPLGFTDLDPEGMLVEGFEELGTMGTIYNFSYYPVHLEKNGYQTPKKGYLAFYIVDKSRGFIDRLPFRKEMVEIDTNPSDVYEIFKDAVSVLRQAQPPKHSSDCQFKKWLQGAIPYQNHISGAN